MLYLVGMAFSVAFHHMGSFVLQPKLHYEGGEVHVVHNVDIDKWSYFEAIGLLKDLGYMDPVRLWWKVKRSNSDEFYKELVVDSDAMEAGSDSLSNNCQCDIYVEHVLSCVEAAEDGYVPEVLMNDQMEQGGRTEEGIVGRDERGKHGGNEKGTSGRNEKGKGIDVGGSGGVDPTDNDDASSDDSVEGIHFDDSEEERNLGMEDGFNIPEVEDVVPQVRPPVDVGVDENQDVGSGGVGLGAVPLVDAFVPEDIENMHVMETIYSSEELDSGDDGDSEDSDGGKPKYVMFRKEHMYKGFRFKLGMEFSSLKDFKEAVKEHSILNGKQIKFVKNDAKRVRVVCKQDCGFTALVSKVGGKTTFRVKTLVSEHTCGRVFDNKNAGSSWVAKAVLDKFRSSQRVTLNEIIDDIRKNYSTGISRSRAIRARKIALEVVEGDATKQYTQLWSYSAELRRVNKGNTCKILLDRPDPNLLPRFGSFYMCLDGCKKGFLAGCRPFIGVDGCHLKTKYGGQLLIAVGRDPNDQYFPLAFAVVETETRASWRWFLTLLLEDIGDVRTNRWVLISDQQKVESNCPSFSIVHLMRLTV